MNVQVYKDSLFRKKSFSEAGPGLLYHILRCGTKERESWCKSPLTQRANHLSHSLSYAPYLLRAAAQHRLLSGSSRRDPQHAYFIYKYEPDSFDMVLGFRASYHPSQSARHDSYQSPLVCPCSACFDKEEHRQIREACDHPAKEIILPSGGGSVPKPAPVWKRADSAGWQKFGLPLGRRRTAESTASIRPLRTAAQEVPQSKQ